MTKQEFMCELARELMSLPPEERMCALKFYDEYLADAGEENEEAVLRDLGSPQEVAKAIREDYAQRNPGPAQGPYRPGPQYQPGGGPQAYTTNPGGLPVRGQPQVYRQGMSGGAVLLLVVLLILGSPIWLTLLAVLVAVVVALAAVAFALVAGFAAAAVGLVAGGVCCVWAALTAPVLATPGLRLLSAGVGLTVLGVGLLAVVFCIWAAVHILPALFRGLVELCRKPFHRQKGGVN